MLTTLEPTISLNNGSYFNFLEPENADFTVYDVANALSKICRFTGQGDNFYSVAEHAIHVSYLVSEELAMDGLMHDATEFVIGDVSTPLKQLLPEYKVIELNIEKDMCRRFGLQFPLPKAVKYADTQMFYLEKELVINNFDDFDFLTGIEKPHIKLHFYNHREAKTAFLERYFELKRKREQ